MLLLTFVAKMPGPYAQVPPNAIESPSPFRITIPETDLEEFYTLLTLSKIAAPTYENLQEDRRYGVSSKWLAGAKDYWLNEFVW